MKLNPVNRPKGHNRYCGPAVISAITGCTTNDAASLIRKFGGRQWRPIRGTYRDEILNVLGLFSVTRRPTLATWPRLTPCKLERRPTLTQWLRAHKERITDGRVYLVDAGNHWQLVSGNKFVCGITREVVSIKSEKVRRRARVKWAVELQANQPDGEFELFSVAADWLTHEARVKKQKTRKAAALRKRGASLPMLAKRAAAIDVAFEVDNDEWYQDKTLGMQRDMTIWIFPNEDKWSEDIHEGDHYAHSLEDAATRIEQLEKRAPELNTVREQS